MGESELNGAQSLFAPCAPRRRRSGALPGPAPSSPAGLLGKIGSRRLCLSSALGIVGKAMGKAMGKAKGDREETAGGGGEMKSMRAEEMLIENTKRKRGRGIFIV